MEEIRNGISYRYWLHRDVGILGSDGLVFVLLNPSTATATEDDPTIRRCMGFADAWGFRDLTVVNLFAMRATDPKEMMAAGDRAIGPRNDDALQWAAKIGTTVAAWGNHGAHLKRAEAVLPMITPAFAMRLTQARQPQHPLYLPSNLQAHLELSI